MAAGAAGATAAAGAAATAGAGTALAGSLALTAEPLADNKKILHRLKKGSFKRGNLEIWEQ